MRRFGAATARLEEMRVRGLPEQDELVDYGLAEGKTFSSDLASEAFLNAAFAGPNPPKIGEHVTIVRKGVSYPLVVVGLLREASLSTVVIPRGTAQRIFGLEGKLSGAYVKFGKAQVTKKVVTAAPAAPRGSNAEVVERLDLDETPTVAVATATRTTDPKTALLEDELVTGVEVRTEYAAATLAYLSSFNVIVVPFIGLSGVLAFFFLVSVLGFLLLERETEYAIALRSLGYNGFEIARIVLTEVGLLAMASVSCYPSARGPSRRTFFACRWRRRGSKCRSTFAPMTSWSRRSRRSSSWSSPRFRAFVRSCHDGSVFCSARPRDRLRRRSRRRRTPDPTADKTADKGR